MARNVLEWTSNWYDETEKDSLMLREARSSSSSSTPGELTATGSARTSGAASLDVVASGLNNYPLPQSTKHSFVTRMPAGEGRRVMRQLTAIRPLPARTGTCSNATFRNIFRASIIIEAEYACLKKIKRNCLTLNGENTIMKIVIKDDVQCHLRLPVAAAGYQPKEKSYA